MASRALVANRLLRHLYDRTTRNPQIEIRLDVSDRVIDIAEGEADIGIRC
jgi:LysR family glycine cleavage system transcriptional activator